MRASGMIVIWRAAIAERRNRTPQKALEIKGNVRSAEVVSTFAKFLID